MIADLTTTADLTTIADLTRVELNLTAEPLRRFWSGSILYRFRIE